MALISYTDIVFGDESPKPIVGLPPGAKVRIRLRSGDFARAFVRYPDRIEEWYLGDPGHGYWVLMLHKGTNVR